MADLAEEVPDIELRDKLAPRDEPGTEPFHRLRGRPLRPEPVRARQEIRLEEGFQHDLGRLPGHPVTHRRNAERPLAAIGLRDVHAPGRRGTVLTCTQISLEFPEQPGNPVDLLHVRQGDTIHPGGPAVLLHSLPRLPQDVTPADTVIQGVETPIRRLLGRSP
jgi:hypothetical protein